MFHFYLLIAYGYVLIRYIFRLNVSKKIKIVLAVLLLIIANYHLIQRVFFGNMFSPEIPRNLIILAGWSFCTFVLLFFVVLLIDIISLLLKCFNVSLKNKLNKSTVQWSLVTSLCLVSAIGIATAIKVPAINKIDITIKNLPRALDGYKVIQLSDLHISRLFNASWTRQVVARTNSLSPNLIVITGDLIDGTVNARMLDVEPLKALEAKQGVFAILGNYEYYFDANEWTQRFNELGINTLINQSVVLDINNQPLAIAGIAYEAAISAGLDAPSLNKALSHIPKNTPIILLKHRPEAAKQSASHNVSLQLSGHTHGGMIRGLDQILRLANDDYVSGKYSVGDMALYVSNGTALWNGFPIRLGVPAEITEIMLHTDKAE